MATCVTVGTWTAFPRWLGFKVKIRDWFRVELQG